ncbi:MAG: fibronectin type III domain-containing protein [Planctomycetaceae bacterium]|nr:fibronectin type III domain-containing protein [Planctomycetaceae bacterium]
MFRSILPQNPKNKARRQLNFESLEFRELLSVSAAEIPQPDFEPASESAYLDVANASKSSKSLEVSDASNASDLSDQSGLSKNSDAEQNDSAVVLLADSAINLAPPKSAKPAYKATPTTLEIFWNTPVATKTLNTSEITGFEITVRNSKTKELIGSPITVDADVRSILLEGLDVKTKYAIEVTSFGGADTSSAKATLKINATTATFPAITARASNLTMTSALLTITDRDKATPFIDGKTTKTYTIQYVEKTTSTPDWSKAETATIGSGEPILDAKKGTVAVKINDLKPGVSYFFRVLTSYTDGVTVEKELSMEGRQSTLKTANLPATTISKTFFSLDKTNYEFAIGLNGKIANISKLDSGITVSFSLLVSTAVKVTKATGKLEDAQVISLPADSFTAIDSKGVFSMKPVDIQSILDILGAGKMLASKTISVQLEVSFSGIATTSYSKMSKVTMPSWYNVS